MLQAACHKVTTHILSVARRSAAVQCGAVQLTVNCSSTEISDEDEDELKTKMKMKMRSLRQVDNINFQLCRYRIEITA